MGLRKCPNCGSTKFKARLIYGAIVESQKDGTFKILEQGSQYAVEPFECTCGANFTDWNSQLINEASVCTVCGAESDTVDESGKCEICRFYEKYPALANIPTEDLVKYFIHQQMHQKAQSHAVPTPAPVQETSADTAPVPQEQNKQPAAPITEAAQSKVDSAQQAVEAAKKGTKRKPRKKKDAQAAEQPQASQEENTQPQPVPADEGQSAQQPEQQQPVQQTDGSWINNSGLGLPDDSQDSNPFMNGDMNSMFNPNFGDADGQQADNAMAEMFGTPADGQQAF